MTVLTAFGKGLILLFRSLRMWLLFYLINVGLALIVAAPLHDLIQSKLGRSMVLEDLLEGFDYSVFRDFLNLDQVKGAITTINNQSVGMLLFFFVLSIFLMGGVLQRFKEHDQRFRFSHYWAGCSRYFWRLLRLTIYFSMVHAVVLGLALMLFFVLVGGGNLESLSSEAEYFWALQIVLPVYALLASVFFMVQDYAKIHLVHKDRSWLFGTFWESFYIVFSNFLRTYPLYLLQALVFVGLFAAYWYVDQQIQAIDARGVALSFALGQAFVLARIGSKFFNLASATHLYQIIRGEKDKEEAVLSVHLGD
ncbi:MAG: hypothetical protein AAFV25_20470, partial [Bacteroidota bacterium]